jgi:hypothetical protein
MLRGLRILLTLVGAGLLLQLVQAVHQQVSGGEFLTGWGSLVALVACFAIAYWLSGVLVSVVRLWGRR